MFQLDEASGEGYSSAHILGQHGFLENIVWGEKPLLDTNGFGKQSVLEDIPSKRTTFSSREDRCGWIL